jgi:alpha-tubulin suppressor-like RCC1 family protein
VKRLSCLGLIAVLGACDLAQEPIPPTGFVSIRAGGDNTCALRSSGVAYCWGENSYGQLATDTNEFNHSTIPVAVETPHHFVQLGVGRFISCGRRGDGRVFCWGIVYDPAGGISTTPRSVSGTKAYQRIDVTGRWSCGLDFQNALYCWGSYWANANPIRLNDTLQFSQLAVGESGICARSGTAITCSSPEAVLWGVDPLPADPQTDIFKIVTGNHAWTSLEVGEAHACGHTTAGELYCWGENNRMQIGVDSVPSFGWIGSPFRIEGAPAFASLALGAQFSCGLTAAGEAWCWGWNGSGQLGSGNDMVLCGLTLTCRPTPAPVNTDQRFVQISAGDFHACGLTAAGEAWCWGANHRGQLGDGTTTPRNAPVRVGDP